MFKVFDTALFEKIKTTGGMEKERNETKGVIRSSSNTIRVFTYYWTF